MPPNMTFDLQIWLLIKHAPYISVCTIQSTFEGIFYLPVQCISRHSSDFVLKRKLIAFWTFQSKATFVVYTGQNTHFSTDLSLAPGLPSLSNTRNIFRKVSLHILKCCQDTTCTAYSLWFPTAKGFYVHKKPAAALVWTDKESIHYQLTWAPT